MKRLLGMFFLVGVIAGTYFLVSVFTQGHDFKDKSVQLMKERGQKSLLNSTNFQDAKTVTYCSPPHLTKIISLVKPLKEDQFISTKIRIC